MDLFHAALKQRLDEAARLTDWQRQMAAGIAAAHPLTPTTRVRAKGNHLAAQNDEPELTDAAIQAEVTRLNAQKARRYHEANDRAARALDQQASDCGLLR